MSTLMVGPALHTADDIYRMYLQLNQAIWEWARRTDRFSGSWYTPDPQIIAMMHQYAYTVRDYLIGYGIPATYSEAWSAKDNKIHLASNGTWWRVNQYYLEVCILEDGVADIWVGLNSNKYVWCQATNMEQGTTMEYVGMVDLVPLVRRTIDWVRAQAHCTGCYYSDGGNYMEGDGIQYCGLGRELLSDCNTYIPRTQHDAHTK